MLYVGILYVIDKWESKNTNDAKNLAIGTSYVTDASTTIEDEDGNVVGHKVVIVPKTDNTGYEVIYDDSDDNLEHVKNRLEGMHEDPEDYTDFELAVLGALMDNGADLRNYKTKELKIIPLFIKAESCTQYLDLRPNNQKFPNGIENGYVPKEIDENGTEISGVILVQRTNTETDIPVTLEYKKQEDFNSLVSNNNIDAKNYFTVDNDGNLVIAKWESIDTKVSGEYPEELEDSEKEIEEKQYFITTEPIAYSQMIKNCTMPFEFLIQLLITTGDTDFCKELVDYVFDSKIVINIQEEETITNTTEERKYTVHTKDEKYIDYQFAPIEYERNYLLRNAKDDKLNDCTNYSVKEYPVTINREERRHSYVLEVIESDTWLAHYKKTYAKTDALPAQNDTLPPIDKKAEEYKYPEEPIVPEQKEIENDKDVKSFKANKEKEYRGKVQKPTVNVTTYMNQTNRRTYKKINISPENKFTTNLSAYEFNERQVTDEDGNITYVYDMPENFTVTSIGTNDFPYEIEYNYKLNDDYTYSLIGNNENDLLKCNILQLVIEPSYKIDYYNEITTTTIEYPSDPNPIEEKHIYATESGEPGRGSLDKETVYEKFLVAYNNNKNAREQMNSIGSWQFEMMEDGDASQWLIESLKYLLYMYDGRDTGVTELNLDIFEQSEFKSALMSNKSIMKQYNRYWERSSPPPTNADGTKYIIEDDGNGHLTVGYGVNIENSKYKDAFIKAGYPTTIGGEVDIDFVDNIEDLILDDCIRKIKAQTANLHLTEYQINALVLRAYNCDGDVDAAISVLRGSPELNFADSYNKYWKKDSDDNFESKNMNVNFNHSLYTQYMSKPVTLDGKYNAELERRRKSEWTLFQTGYYDVLQMWHSTTGEIVQIADEIHNQEMTWTYSVGSNLFWSNIEKSLNNPNKVTCCATYVSCVIYKAGYFTETQMNSFNYNSAPGLYKYLENQGWSKITSYDALEPGDIVFTDNDPDADVDHTQIYAGNQTWYSAGDTTSIQRPAPYNQGNWAKNNFYAAFRPN